MEDFDVAPLESFTPAAALERMLRLLMTLFEDVCAHKRELLVPDLQDTFSHPLEEACMQALVVAREDTCELIRNLQTVDFTLTEKEHLRLSGPVLRLKMMAIKTALDEANDVHPLHGHAARRGWALYRRAVEILFALMDAPLVTLVRVVDGPRGAIEFKQTLEGLLRLKSGPAA